MKLKNVVIWALVAINLFFLALCVWKLAASHARRSEARAALCALMSRNGIALDCDGIHEDGEMAVLETQRDSAAESRIAEALLGQTRAVDMGGNITSYVGESGEAVFRGGGEYRAVFYRAVHSAGTDAEKTARRLLKAMGIEARDASVSVEGADETVQFTCAIRGRAVFNWKVKFVFSGGSLSEVSGRCISGVRTGGGKVDMSSAATALTVFLAAVRDGRVECSEIRLVEPGYSFAVVSAYGDGRLAPVWLVEADTGAYYVDPASGSVEQSTA